MLLPTAQYAGSRFEKGTSSILKYIVHTYSVLKMKQQHREVP